MLNGSGSLTKHGAGTLTLNQANSYTGTTTIDTGILATGAAGSISQSASVSTNTNGTLLLQNTSNQIGNTATVNLAGGRLRISDTVAGLTEDFGALTLSASSIIDFGIGATDATKNVLNFASINLDDLSAFTHSIYNWSGNVTVGGGDDQLYFSTYSGSTANLGNIRFYSDAGITQIPDGLNYQTLILGTNEFVPVPEPSTYLGGGLVLFLAGWSQRRRFLKPRTTPWGIRARCIRPVGSG